MTEQELETLNKLLTRQRKIKITLGSIFGLILTIYFLTFAMLLDKAPAGFFTFEMITGTALAIALFMLNRISFALTKRLANRNQRALLDKVDHSAVDKKPEQLQRELAGR